MQRRTAAIVALSVIGALVVAVFAALLVLTQTDWGRERVRRIALAQLGKIVHGHITLDRVEGNLLGGATLVGVAITDSTGQPFLKADSVVASYGLGSFFRKHITLDNVRLVRPEFVLARKTGGKWNYQRIFPRDTVPHPPSAPGFGSWITLTNTTIVDGRVTIRAPWVPSDTLKPAQRDSVIRYALSPESRSYVVRADSGFQRISDFRDIYGELPLLRLADPDHPAQLIEVSSLRMTAEPLRPPSVRVTNANGRFTILNDSLYFTGARVALASSRLSGSGRYNFDNDDLRLRLRADTLSTNDLLWIDPSIPQNGTGKTDFALDWVGPVSDYQARNASLAVQGARLAGDLGVTVTDTFAFHDTNLRFQRLDTRTIAQLFPTLKSPRQGYLTGQMAAAGGFGAMHVDGDVTFDDPISGRSRVIALGTVGARGGVTRATDLHITLSPLRVALVRAVAPRFPLAGTLTGKATLDGATNTRLDAVADLTHEDVTGRSHVVGTGAFATGGRVPLINANLRLLPLSLATAGQFVPSLGLHGTVTGPVKATGPMRNLAVSSALTTPDGGSIGVRGTLDLVAPSPAYDVATNAHLFDASVISSKAPKTSISAEASVRGTGFAPATMNAVASAVVHGSTYDSVAVDSAVVKLAASNGMLRVDTLALNAPHTYANATGTFGLVQGKAGTLRYVAAVDSLAALRRILPPADTGVVPPRPSILANRIARARADSAQRASRTEVARAATGGPPPKMAPVDTPRVIPRNRLAGSLQAQGTATGNIHTFDLNGTASGRDIVAFGNSASAFSARYAWNTAFTPQSHVSAQAVATKVVAAGFALDTVSIGGEYRKPSGTVNLVIHQDTGLVYNANAAFTLNRERNDVHLNTLRLQFDTVVYASSGPSLIHFGPSGIDIDKFEIKTPLGRRVYVNGTVPTNGAANLDIGVNQFDVSYITTLLQSSVDAKGLVSFDGHLSGTRADPRVNGVFGVERFIYGGRPTPELHGKMDYATQTLTANASANLEGGPPILTAQGTVPVNLALTSVTGSRIPRNRTIAATVTADSLPLESLPQFTDVVANLGGRAYARFTVGGTVENPLVDGRIAWWNGSVKIVPTGVTYYDVATNIRLNRDTVVLDSLVARSGGTIRASGGVGIRSLSQPSFDLQLAARNARVLDNDKGNLRIDTDATMVGPFNNADVIGTAQVLNGVIYIPQSSGKTLVGAGDPALFAVLDTSLASQRELFPAQSPLLANLRVNYAVGVNRDVFVRSTEANVEVYSDGDLHVNVDRAKQSLTIDGVLLSDRGEYRFQGRRFQIQRGSATFVNLPELNPTLQVTADYPVELPTREPFSIQIIISGTLDQPKIALQSTAQPPIPQTDLLSYLAFGRPSGSLLQQEGGGITTGGSGGSNVVGQGAAFAAKQVSAAALGALTDQISGEAVRSLGADFFNIAPADVSLDVGSFLRGTQVEYGKYIQTRTFLQLQVRPDPQSLQRPGFVLSHRFDPRSGYQLQLTLEPRYLQKQPTLDPNQTPVTTSSFGMFLIRDWRF
jgi:translocation and assembly module TamB